MTGRGGSIVSTSDDLYEKDRQYSVHALSSPTNMSSNADNEDLQLLDVVSSFDGFQTSSRIVSNSLCQAPSR